jgi:hypothetical protein
MEDRTRTEIIVKTLALQIAVIASAGHLASLQRQSKRHSKKVIWDIAWFVAVPIYPVALFIDRVVACADLVRQKGFRSVKLRYCVAGISGAHAELRTAVQQDKPDTAVLLSVSSEDVRRVPLARDWLWVGRLFLLLALTTQSTGTLILSFRRLKANQMGETDIRNAGMALGGLAVQLTSILILSLNERWEVTPEATLHISQHNTTHKRPSIITKLLVTASMLLHSWYFRFHIRDTWIQ